MPYRNRLDAYEHLVEKRFNIYNGLFLSLPFRGVTNTGESLPRLYTLCKQGLEKGMSPEEIITQYFNEHPHSLSDEEKTNFLFNVIQYIERQVVLFDSIEDAAFPIISKMGENSSLDDYLLSLDNSKNHETILNKLKDFSVRIVFTAHPTQFYPPQVLDIINEMRGLVKNDNISEIDKRLQQLGMTSFIKKSKPTPVEEANNIIYYLRNIYYDALGEYYGQLKKNIYKEEGINNYNLIKIGFWPGGDRDGNPFVTADVTKKVAENLRTSLMKCYYNDVKRLQKKLTFKGVQNKLSSLRTQLYDNMFGQAAPLSYDEIITPLIEIHKTIASKFNNLYIDELENLIHKVSVFKTHFASLDIRQDHSKHVLVVSKIISKYKLFDGDLQNLKVEEFHEILKKDIPKLNPNDFDEPIVKDTIKNIQGLRQIQKSNGEAGCNRYIISNSEDPLSILFVLALFRWCGWEEPDITFDIIPLFETMKGMKNAKSTMTYLFKSSDYSSHLKRRNNNQTIMLGFSDGTKDGGYLRANWEIFKTKETLTSVCQENNINAIFFDGRGGPPARGGGKTHRFYASLGNNIANNEIQLTIQGQTITSMFGSPEQFIFNSEQMLTAGLSNHINYSENELINNKQRSLIEELAMLSFNKYDSLKKHDQFVSYLENRSTLKYYSKANIGSRPAKRGKKDKLTLSDLRAISFVGSWSQLKQNVPGYFGLGSALYALKKDGRIDEVKELYNNVPFIKALFLNSMMSISKSYFALTKYMDEDPEYSNFWNILFNEFELSRNMLLEISNFSELMEEEPISKKSIKIREKIVLPLLTVQQYALQQINKNSKNKELFEKIVSRSLYGNINASRNSA